MGIIRTYKIKCDDGKELIITEPLGPIGEVTLEIFDEGNNLAETVRIDKEVWSEVKHG